MKIDFTWDRNKSYENQRKHAISFEEAKTVFFDDNARLLHDPDHSETNNDSSLGRVSVSILIVCHCYRENDTLIRIISARKASKNEQKQYLEYLHEKRIHFSKSLKIPTQRN
jgi:uncharacterized DUF497 family protein